VARQGTNSPVARIEPRPDDEIGPDLSDGDRSRPASGAWGLRSGPNWPG